MQSTANLKQIQMALAQKYLASQIIPEYDIMRAQTNILNNIKNLMQKKKPDIGEQNETMTHINNSSDFGMLQSPMGNYSNNMPGFLDDSGTGKSKFKQEFQQSVLSSVLRDIKTNCNEQTYSFVRQRLQNGKTGYQSKQISLCKQQNESLSSQIYVLKIEKTNLEKELDRYKKQVQCIQDEKKNVKKKIDYVLDKENKLYKLQMSFAFKQKINLQMKKKYQRLRDNAYALQRKVQKIYIALNEIWNSIREKVQSVSCPGQCWRKEAMNKCRQQLITQRSILKQQTAYIQKQYEVMNAVASQFKKIFNQNEFGNKQKSTISQKQGEQNK